MVSVVVTEGDDDVVLDTCVSTVVNKMNKKTINEIIGALAMGLLPQNFFFELNSGKVPGWGRQAGRPAGRPVSQTGRHQRFGPASQPVQDCVESGRGASLSPLP